MSEETHDVRPSTRSMLRVEPAGGVAGPASGAASISESDAEPTVAASPSGVMRDRSLDDQVQDDALKQVVGNLAPLQVMLLPLSLMVAAVMRHDVSEQRLSVWVATAIATTMIVFAACSWSRSHPIVDRTTTVLAGVALASVGSVAGLSTWVAAASALDVETMFALFPAVSLAVGTIVCAGRRDMFLAYAIPLTACASFGLVSSGDTRMQALAALYVGYGITQLALHHTVSRSLLASLRLQFTSQALAVRMASDQLALTDAYEQLSETNARLAYLASHDPLTGLLNRRGTIERIDELLAADDESVALLFCDLDRFKAINDLLGHRGGDQFITVLADRIARTIDHGCVAGRIGGDEFVIVLPHHDTARASAVASRLVDVLAQPVHAEGRAVPSSVSIGVASAPLHGASTSDLLRNANAALYRAKHAGRNRVELFDGDMHQELEAMLESEHSLRRAIDDGEIMPFFQPEIDAATGRIVGAELLARWLRPDGTVAAANEFINIARKAGLLERLTEKVFAHARPDIRRLASFGLPDGFRFRVNLAPSSTDRSWRNNPLDELVRGIDPSLITVDVRESAVIADLPTAAATLAAFRARGGRVCLDDFARGVSSLSLLRKLPIDEVRVDRQAIDTITSHPHDRAIVRSIISVVREIGLSVTAEGVENGAQADALIALGCVRQQGHHYARAMPAEQFEAYLVQRQAEGYAASAAPSTEWNLDDLG
jgi:diguanylate cyclase (GGDEF)-like protein